MRAPVIHIIQPQLSPRISTMISVLHRLQKHRITALWTSSYESGYWLRLNANAGVPSRLPPISALALHDTAAIYAGYHCSLSSIV
eukprot:scaffold73397_cov19-Prasinocladus_malaysianus.AAC.1